MTRPNVLLLFTDQQRFDTIAALGNPIIKTPAMDRLVQTGTAFTSAYTCSPVCISARCSLIYGQYPMRTKNYSNEGKTPVTGKDTFMAALTRAGYRTHGIGKMHFWPDRDDLCGFQARQIQEEFSPSVAEDDYLSFAHERGYDYVCDPHGRRGDMYYVPQISPFRAQDHPTHWVGDQAINFIQTNKGADQPWMLWASFIHPHPPFNPPNPWHRLYDAPEMPLPKVPPNSDALHMYINRVQNRRKGCENMGLNLLRSVRAYYYACISFIDYQIGRILDTLQATGQLDNTLILLTADHGEHLGDYNCFGKRSMHDTCAKIPMLGVWPGQFQADTRCNVPVSLLDVASTILQVAETELSTHKLDGLSLIDRATESSRPVFSQYERGDNAVYMAVTDRWKYCYSAPDNQEYLFDRVKDPEETRNRSGIGYLDDQQANMRLLLFDHLRAGGETDNIDGDTWRKTPRMEIENSPDALLRRTEQLHTDVALPGYADS